ncbi:MAG: 2-oxo acid dehydrogenase subunit E2 [Acidobacteria bacterium]|nr:MAG: 2-oxo acid dehydrogenase subunit E2 [Acidobacteriota bacterium]
MLFEFKLPDIGEGVVEGEIVKWLVGDGESVREDQPLVEVMTDKATVEIPSPVAGKVTKRHGQEGGTISVGAVLVEIETGNGTPKQQAKSVEREMAVPVRRAQHAMDVLATPAVRRLARERGIDLTKVKGSGPAGRITLEDLSQHQPEAEKPEAAVQTSTPVESEETLPYRGLRRKIGERMITSKTTAPHYTYVEEVDVSELSRVRSIYNEMSGGRLTYLPFIIKAVVEGLRKYPLLNSSLDEENGVIRVKHYYNIGIATATEDGLIVPVIKEADQKSVLDLAKEIARLSDAAKAGKIKVEELKGGTFTITSLGSLGGLMATPIINYPEVAILGLHKISPRPVVKDNQIVVREMMNLSISLDHRVVDGAIAAQFVAHVRMYLENPGLLALGSL